MTFEEYLRSLPGMDQKNTDVPLGMTARNGDYALSIHVEGKYFLVTENRVLGLLPPAAKE